jgi:hypothetical protein
MISYAISRESLSKTQRAYLDRLQRSLTRTKGNCQRIENALADCRTAEAVFEAAAQPYSAMRGYASLFVCFQHHDHSLRVMSASKVLRAEGGETSIPQDNVLDKPNPFLHQILDERLSARIPYVGDLDRPVVQVEFLGGEGGLREGHDTRGITAALPSHFKRKTGSLLFTPLGIERSTAFGLGYFCEYQEFGQFDLASIHTARVYSALFTWQIVERLVAEISNTAL